jgi:hypothetical protein
MPSARLVQHDVDLDLTGLAVVPAHRVVAPLLLGSAVGEAPARERQHDLLAGRDEQQRDDVAGLLDRPAVAKALAGERDADHPWRQLPSLGQPGDPAAAWEAPEAGHQPRTSPGRLAGTTIGAPVAGQGTTRHSSPNTLSTSSA